MIKALALALNLFVHFHIDWEPRKFLGYFFNVPHLDRPGVTLNFIDNDWFLRLEFPKGIEAEEKLGNVNLIKHGAVTKLTINHDTMSVFFWMSPSNFWSFPTAFEEISILAFGDLRSVSASTSSIRADAVPSPLKLHWEVILEEFFREHAFSATPLSMLKNQVVLSNFVPLDGSLSMVFDIDFELRGLSGLSAPIEPDFINFGVRPGLITSNIASVSGHAAGGKESPSDKYNTDECDNRYPDSDDQHSESPRSHILLGLQIIFGLFISAICVYIFSNTLKPGKDAVSAYGDAAFFQALFACIGLVLGGVISFIGMILSIG